MCIDLFRRRVCAWFLKSLETRVQVATYTTPSGRSLNKVGVTPNYKLAACAPLNNVEDCLGTDLGALKTPSPQSIALASQ